MIGLTLRRRPWLIVAVSLLASWWCASAMLAWILQENEKKALARRLWIWSVSIGGILALAALASPVSWVWLALGLGFVNLAGGLGLRYLLQTSFPPVMPSVHPVSLGGFTASAIGGGLLTGYAGYSLGILYLGIIDAGLSTLVPTLTGRISIATQCIGFGIQLMLCGAIVSARQYSREGTFRLSSFCKAAAAICGFFYMSHFIDTLIIDVPAFQSDLSFQGQILGHSLLNGMAWILRFAISIVGALWIVDASSRMSRQQATARMSLALLCVILCPCVLTVYTGGMASGYLWAGTVMEKRGSWPRAEYLYDRGLAQRPESKVSAALQFRVAMIYRKKNELSNARAAFQKVVTEYTDRSELVKNAQRFLEALEKAPVTARRVTLPGIDTSTEFKAGYCVPNSLALVHRYWGHRETAKQIGQRITALDFGTIRPDAVWYSETHGLRHGLRALSTIEDIHHFIDQQIPVLIYIPQHVLAVVGYDEALDSLITYDVAEADIWVDHPLRDLLPLWRKEMAVISIVLPPERLAALPEAERHRFEEETTGQLHWDIHEPLHHSDRAGDTALAMQHVYAAQKHAPNYFFALAHSYRRSPSQREKDRRDPSTRRVAEEGLSFARENFDNEEVLEELGLMLDDMGQKETVRAMLEERQKEGGLQSLSSLVGLLGLLDNDHGDYEKATALLSSLPLTSPDRFPWMLGQAYEAKAAWSSAVNAYLSLIVDPNRAKLEEAMTKVPSWLRQKFPDWENSSTASLKLQRAALERLEALQTQTHDAAPMINAANHYLNGFPWDVTVLMQTVRAIQDRFAQDVQISKEDRKRMVRQLEWSLRTLRGMPITESERASCNASEQLLEKFKAHL